MTVKELANRLGYEVVCMPEPDRDVTGGYAGDLLSWVMGRATDEDAWITIMTNNNIIAVASLADVPCIIICEGCEIEEDLLNLTKDKGINLFVSEESEFTVAGKLYALLNN